MNLPANFPLKKVIITVVSVVIVIALIITGVTVAVNGKAANATVDVEQISNISTSRVVWRPRPSFWLMEPVSRCNSGARAFSSVDLPTPELPQKAQR